MGNPSSGQSVCNVANALIQILRNTRDIITTVSIEQLRAIRKDVQSFIKFAAYADKHIWASDNITVRHVAEIVKKGLLSNNVKLNLIGLAFIITVVLHNKTNPEMSRAMDIGVQRILSDNV